MDTDAVQVDPRRVELTELVIESFRDRQGPAIHHPVFSSARDETLTHTWHETTTIDNDDNKKLKYKSGPY